MGKKTSQLCLACGERPASPSAGTVALCTQCQSLAKGKERGVNFDKGREKTA
jgi:DNA-directed RNA polymerase subunit RPC12/RpoP